MSDTLESLYHAVLNHSKTIGPDDDDDEDEDFEPPTMSTAGFTSMADLLDDKLRLDFLDKAKSAEYREGTCCWEINGVETGETIRDAIDAARKHTS